MPRYAPMARRLPWLMNAREWVPGARHLTELTLGLAASRPLPTWRGDVFDPGATSIGPVDGREVVLWADTFSRFFDREILEAALEVLVAAGCKVQLARPGDGSSRPLCCGRTFLSAGLVDEARAEARRSIAVLEPYAKRGVPIIGLEPSCLLTFRDEALRLGLGEAAVKVSEQAMLFEEYLARESAAGRLTLALGPIAAKALLHGHCHQKSFGAMGAIERTLRLIPGLAVETIESSCCGMAGAFGYQAETVEISRAMGEASLLPAVRSAEPGTLIVADGTSCRAQIADGANQDALHVAQVLAMSVRSAKAANRETTEDMPA